MRKYLYIGIGGIIGAILRYLIKEFKFDQDHGAIPVDTLFINTFGCFLTAFIVAAALGKLGISPDLKLGITTGFVGAFTAFSSLCKETAMLFNQGFNFSAVSYAVISIFLAFIAIILGTALARKFIIRKTEDEKA